MNQTHYKILKMLYDKDKVSAVDRHAPLTKP